MAVILVIDDEAMIRGVIRRALERQNHTVLEASNGTGAMEFARERQIDLVITDLVMPEMEGIETIMTMRRLFPNTLILAISGGGTAKVMYLEDAQRLGADAALSKPFRPAELVRVVNSLLAQKQAPVRSQRPAP